MQQVSRTNISLQQVPRTKISTQQVHEKHNFHEKKTMHKFHEERNLNAKSFTKKN